MRVTKKDNEMTKNSIDSAIVSMTIDINEYKGSIPNGFDLVAYEDGQEEFLGSEEFVPNIKQLVLYSFDEVGLFDHQFANIKYAFVKG